MNEFSIFDVAAAGMSLQRGLLDLAARNVAAAQVAGPGGAFERLVPLFTQQPLGAGGADPAAGDGLEVAFGDGMELTRGEGPDGVTLDDAGAGTVVRLAGARPMPGSEADAVTEMVAVLAAQRAYEANASVFDAGKRLAERTIDLGRL
jgi:flagellar basal-body rod protein FlgC